MIVNRAQDYTSTNLTLNPPLQEGQVNPMRRDTIVVPPSTSATLRIVADNPGVWFFHCTRDVYTYSSPMTKRWMV